MWGDTTECDAVSQPQHHFLSKTQLLQLIILMKEQGLNKMQVSSEGLPELLVEMQKLTPKALTTKGLKSIILPCSLGADHVQQSLKTTGSEACHSKGLQGHQARKIRASRAGLYRAPQR